MSNESTIHRLPSEELLVVAKQLRNEAQSTLMNSPEFTSSLAEEWLELGTSSDRVNYTAHNLMVTVVQRPNLLMQIVFHKIPERLNDPNKIMVEEAMIRTGKHLDLMGRRITYWHRDFLKMDDRSWVRYPISDTQLAVEGIRGMIKKLRGEDSEYESADQKRLQIVQLQGELQEAQAKLYQI